MYVGISIISKEKNIFKKKTQNNLVRYGACTMYGTSTVVGHYRHQELQGWNNVLDRQV